MKALVYVGDATVRQLEVAPPHAGSGEVMVRVLQAGVCGTDMCVVRDERPKAVAPMTLGHEFVGLRQDTGERVIVNPLLACGHCRACGEGRPHLCDNRQVIGVHRNGGFAEAVAVPERNLVPAGRATTTQAAMADPVATALHAYRLAARAIGTGPVAILGAGSIGLSLLFVLKRFGVRDITVTDLSAERRAFADAGGADRTAQGIDASFDVIFDSVGAVATRRDAGLRVRPGGTAVLVGLHSADLALPAGPLIGGERTLQGSFGYTPDEFREAVSMLPDLDTRWVHAVPFDEAEQMFTRLLEGRLPPGQIKLQMRMSA
ncbi:Putative L-galactonate oxidoreductase [Variovorax sp. PBS-H4]|uniref:zinc-dependent alcohol dehydrogenase n=1 Tax=Variovorax sp. PBS-H4 TaxID=434008 RepID=UPI00131801B3|nr:alcohol dehydrogenase catalytic domain-containing protein [Variovorax sp. PBS-H4]VTU24425.1 Putative L-galactonate oxidoreductase [Variovorax sp. PBS-H4]